MDCKAGPVSYHPRETSRTLHREVEVIVGVILGDIESKGNTAIAGSKSRSNLCVYRGGGCD
jgi:hypothetical protein